MALSNVEQARIRHVEQEVTRLIERVDNLRLDGSRIEKVAADAATRVWDAEQRLAVAVRDAEELKKKVEELLARRWELWKIVFAAILTSVLTLAGSFALRAFDGVSGVRAGPGTSRPALK